MTEVLILHGNINFSTKFPFLAIYFIKLLLVIAEIENYTIDILDRNSANYFLGY